MKQDAWKQVLAHMVDELGEGPARGMFKLLPLTRWSCFCDPPREQIIQPTRHGRLYSSCRVCQSRIFWIDLTEFFLTSGVCRHAPPVMPTRKEGRATTWCPLCGVRTFFPGWLNGGDQLATADAEEEPRGRSRVRQHGRA